MLKWGPSIEINYAEFIVMDDLEGLDTEHKDPIRQRVLKLSVNNHNHANEAYCKIVRKFCRLYKLLSRLANDNHIVLRVYLKLFSITDGNLHRLVISKLLTIFKPAVRRALAKIASGSLALT